jgi:hypothetical protein
MVGVVSRIRILFLGACPLTTTRLALALDEECAAIERELSMTPRRDDFEFRSKWAVSVDEMMRHLNEWEPTIIHFSGHGSPDTSVNLHGQARVAPQPQPQPTRDVESAGGAGIYLQEDHRSQYVSERALAQMISSAAPSARLVVLNACFTDAVAESLCHSVECVVGINGPIGDAAACSFAVAFYRALGNRRSIGNAVAQAGATLAAKHRSDEPHPICRTRDGVSADQVFLAD